MVCVLEIPYLMEVHPELLFYSICMSSCSHIPEKELNNKGAIVNKTPYLVLSLSTASAFSISMTMPCSVTLCPKYHKLLRIS
ncbi:hypothetical protein T08_12385 [Trichinella sp. T8]|nr:hypothetical protein T08_12385 [Trichinella sp. T8]